MWLGIKDIYFKKETLLKNDSILKNVSVPENFPTNLGLGFISNKEIIFFSFIFHDFSFLINKKRKMNKRYLYLLELEWKTRKSDYNCTFHQFRQRVKGN
jgi:hypothetical protein